ncbi:MAG: hypothetical protein OFPI_08770 [Osedax symbiont Rs2]|nr:MAG: hypothetical protein OFPI_08770 [Osedax symbiont Rs2]
MSSTTGKNTESTTKAIVIIEATFNANGMHTPEFKEYSRRSNANGEARGGMVLGKYQVTDNLAEGELPHLLLVIEYPDIDSARETFSNAEYLSILPLRKVAFKQVKIYTTNSLPL